MGKLTMFFGFVWMVTCIAGGMMLGSVPFASTTLTADITAAAVIINVDDTTGFPTPGILVIGDERIAYSDTTATTFIGTLGQPVIRGTGGTTASAHTEGAVVRMVEGSLVNSAVDYDLAVIADSAGAQAFLSVPTALWDVLMSFGTSPFAFLGTDLQILTMIWGIAFLGMVVSFFVSMAGGRRV